MNEENFRAIIVVALGLILILQFIVLSKNNGCGCMRKRLCDRENYGYRGSCGPQGSNGPYAEGAGWN